MTNRKAVSGVIALVLAAAVAVVAQEDPVEEVEAAWAAAIDRTAPDGYLYEELRRCAGCHEPSAGLDGNSTHRNAIGLTGDPAEPVLTGKGWLSGGHGRSQDASIVSNTFCAWCHAPSQPGVTGDIGAAKPIESGREERYHNMKVAANSDPVTCKPCHHFKPAEVAANCAKLVPERGSTVHEVPAFE